MNTILLFKRFLTTKSFCSGKLLKRKYWAGRDTGKKGVMQYRKLLLLSLCGISLPGCAAGPAVIVDLETDKVVVRKNISTPDEEVEAKAREGCALHDRVPKPLSVSCLDQYCFSSNHLFACLE